LLRDKRRKASFATYALGLLGEGDRKSVEPIAARAVGGATHADATHQRLLHFLTDSVWDDHAVRRMAAAYALKFMTAEQPVEASVIDVTNCQVGVSLSLVTHNDQLPVDFELYLPRSWTDDAARRHEARIPDDVVFKTKQELALGMLTRAKQDGLPLGVLLADSAYGNSAEFRLGLHRLGVPYSVGVAATSKVFQVREVINRGGQAIDLRTLASKLDAKGKFQQFTWRTGSRRELSARFAMRRVAPLGEQHNELSERSTVWLLIEWRDGEADPANYYFSSLPPDTSLKTHHHAALAHGARLRGPQG
jgi:SRSO17 transposase